MCLVEKKEGEAVHHVLLSVAINFYASFSPIYLACGAHCSMKDFNWFNNMLLLYSFRVNIPQVYEHQTLQLRWCVCNIRMLTVSFSHLKLCLSIHWHFGRSRLCTWEASSAGEGQSFLIKYMRSRKNFGFIQFVLLEYLKIDM